MLREPCLGTPTFESNEERRHGVGRSYPGRVVLLTNRLCMTVAWSSRRLDVLLGLHKSKARAKQAKDLRYPGSNNPGRDVPSSSGDMG